MLKREISYVTTFFLNLRFIAHSFEKTILVSPRIAMDHFNNRTNKAGINKIANKKQKKS